MGQEIFLALGPLKNGCPWIEVANEIYGIFLNRYRKIPHWSKLHSEVDSKVCALLISGPGPISCTGTKRKWEGQAEPGEKETTAKKQEGPRRSQIELAETRKKEQKNQKKPLGNTQKGVEPGGTRRSEVSFKEDIGFVMAKLCTRGSPRVRLQLSMTPNQEGQ